MASVFSYEKQYDDFNEVNNIFANLCNNVFQPYDSTSDFFTSLAAPLIFGVLGPVKCVLNLLRSPLVFVCELLRLSLVNSLKGLLLGPVFAVSNMVLHAIAVPISLISIFTRCIKTLLGFCFKTDANQKLISQEKIETQQCFKNTRYYS